tara:strand:- start:2728 stop:2859 length:132 start_codon:yes stop_codon:yes gene_type:complete
VAKLEEAPGLGPGGVKPVQVRVLSPALKGIGYEKDKARISHVM